MSQKRKHTRIDFEENVTLDQNGKRHGGKTRNISQGGALLQTDEPIEYGQKLVMEILLPKIKEPCQIACIVRWCNGNDIGVQFENLRAIEVWALNQLHRANQSS